MFVPPELRKDALINAAVRIVLQEMSPAVKHIRYHIAPDWTDEWAIFFRVVTSDDAADDARRRAAFNNQVRGRIMDELDLPNLGLWPHFDFRTESDLAETNDPEWAATV
jgi:hypothetical protein